ncbi:MAG TPA: TRAP transporter small permease [Brevibacterium sp.]|nr:TRAP transporter small permease [Brevibacterium sp.]
MRAPGLRNDPIPVVENAVIWVSAVFAMVATGATLAIVIVFCVSVIFRWSGAPFDITNLVQGLLVLATFSGMAWTTVRGEHVSVQVVTEKLSARANHVIDIFIWTIATGYLIWLTIAAFELATRRTWPAFEMADTGQGMVAVWPWRWVFAIALIPFIFIVLINLARSIMGRRPYDDVIDLEELAGREIQFVDADTDGDGQIDMAEALKAGSLAAGRTLENDSTHDAPEGGQR